MMVRTAPKSEMSLKGLASFALAIIALSTATFAAALSAEKSTDVSAVMQRAQTQSTARGFESLLNELGSNTGVVLTTDHPNSVVVAKPPVNAVIKTRHTEGA
jgi:hypothetical protein